MANGGHLDIHADFNHHAKMNLERRLYSNVCLSKYFKALQLRHRFEELVEELHTAVKHVGVRRARRGRVKPPQKEIKKFTEAKITRR